MASGTSAQGGWNDLATELNGLFSKANIQGLSDTFKKRHGDKGDGAQAGTTPYKFGRFVDKHGALNTVVDDAKRGRFLIDAGTNRWDTDSISLMEYMVTQSLTNANPKVITFNVIPDPAGKLKAYAVIKDAAHQGVGDPALTTKAQIDAANEYLVTICCPATPPGGGP